MNPRGSDVFPSLHGTLFLAGAALVGVGLGIGIAAGIFHGSAPVAATAIPPAAPSEVIAPLPKPDPMQSVAAAPAPKFDLASADSVSVPAPAPRQMQPAVTAPVATAPAPTPDPVEPAAEAAAPPVEIAALPDPADTLPPVMPLEAALPASMTDPMEQAVEAPASPVDLAKMETVEPASDDADETPVPAPSPRLVSLFRPAPVEEDLKPVVRIAEPSSECMVAQVCIDDYLWAFYERTPKLDTNKVRERIKATVKRKGKIRTVMKTVIRYVAADFTWKDPAAAQRADKSLKDYVIGGMDPTFKVKLYYAMRAMEEAGLMPGITSAFRDDYRQGIASGNKAASDSSFHGGSRRGGYGHGMAADLVSVKGETRSQRFVSTVELWKWIDARETELGIGRPYLNRDPPHVGPIDGKEFAAKRGSARAKLVQPASKRQPVAASGTPDVAKPAAKPAPVRVGSL